MEKQVEKIKTEYCLYDPEEPGSIDYVLDVIFRCIDEAYYFKSLFDDERKKNKIRVKFSSAFGSLAGRVGFLKPDVYEADNDFICLQDKILERYFCQLTDVIEVVDDYNYQDINKLVEFSREKYLANYFSVEEQRKISLLASIGISRERKCSELDSTAVGVFFDETLGNIVSSKVAVKSKSEDAI